jgi:hypothetical protein
MPVGAENAVTSRDLQILVYQATNAISSKRPKRRCGGRRSAARRRVLIKRSVRAVGVVMLDEFMQDQAEVVWSGDQEMVETFAAQRADPAFRDDVCPWCSYRGADDAEADAREHRVERGGELGISVANQEPEPAGVVAEVHEQVASLLSYPGTGGMAGDPRDVHPTGSVLDHDEYIEAA